MRIKHINAEVVISRLFACSVEDLNFTLRSCSLKIRHDQLLKTTGLVLSRCESTGFLIDIPTRIKTGGNDLTHQVEE